MPMCLPILTITYNDPDSVERLDGGRFRANKCVYDTFTELHPMGYEVESKPRSITVTLTPLELNPVIVDELNKIHAYAYSVEYHVEYCTPGGLTTEQVMHKNGKYIYSDDRKMGIMWLLPEDVSKLQDEVNSRESFAFLDMIGR